MARNGNNEEIGRILTDLTVTNRIDEANARRGVIPAERVRSLHLHNVLVDTGATTLCLPRELIERLGLELIRVVDVSTVSTARGVTKARIFQDAKLTLLDREGTFECIELPEGCSTPLLGVLPLEAMGIELDLKNQTLRALPIEGADTYLTIL